MITSDRKTLTGEELFDYYLDQGNDHADVLSEAMLLLDEAELFSLLEEAQRTNQRLEVRQTKNPPEWLSEPDQVVLVPMN